MSGSPWLWLLAGPNGAGKSTYARNLLANVEEIVGPDELAYQLSQDVPESAALQAGRLAVRRRNELLEQRRSFAVETTLSAVVTCYSSSAPGPKAGVSEWFTSGSAAPTWPSSACGNG